MQRLDQELTLQQAVETGGSGAAVTVTYNDLSPTIWAAVDFPGGREFRVLGQRAAECDAIFTIRTNTTVTEKHRVKWGSRLFDIVWVEPVQRQSHQRVTAVEVRP